jgi:hypothetical protein
MDMEDETYTGELEAGRLTETDVITPKNQLINRAVAGTTRAKDHRERMSGAIFSASNVGKS